MSGAREVSPVRQAELQINAILAKLEADTGRCVDDIRLRRADVRRIDSGGHEDLAGAVIELTPDPRSRTWEKLP